MSLRARLTALLVAALVPLAGLAVYWAIWEVRHERAHAEDMAHELADHVAHHAVNLVVTVHEMLAVLARLPAVQRSEAREAERLFRDLLDHSPHLENLGLIEPTGQVAASAAPLPAGQPVRFLDKEWLPRVLRSARPAVGGFYVGRITGKPVAHVAHPVVDTAGRVTAVLFADLRLPAISQEMARMRPRAGVLWAVVDGQGLVLLHGDPGAAIGKPLGPLTGMFRGEAIVPGTGWRAIVGVPETVVAAGVRAGLLGVALPAGVILLVAAAVGVWIARNTWRPLQDLAGAVRRIGAGQPDVRIPMDAGGEVGEVATAFSGTLAALTARERDLRRHAQELATLNDLTRALTTVLDPPALAQAILGAAQSLIPRSAGRLWKRVGDEDVVRLIASTGLRAPEEGLTRRLRLGEGLAGIAVATRLPVTSSDVTADPRFINKEWAAAEGLASCIVVPLVYGERVSGGLAIFTREPHEFTGEEISLLRSFADQAAIAIENARLHEEVRLHAATLEQRVRERTAELEEALRVKAQFLANMSHELRTPLNHVIGFAELLQGQTAGGLTPKQAEYVDRIHQGGKRLLELVNAILDLSAVEAERSRLQSEPVPLAPLVQEVLDLVRLPVARKRLEVTVALDPELPFVVADRGKLRQILAHLMGNAVKFTPEGGTIRLTARGVTEEPRPEPEFVPGHPSSVSWVEIAVADTGIGIKPEDMERIFWAFELADASDTRKYEGAGIGLALVRILVELHGGRVWAESEGPGKGSRFVVRLPLLRASRPKRILVVEAEAMILQGLCDALARAGFAVDQAHSGAAALERLAVVQPDLLILDVGLPDLPGWEVLRQVRGQGPTRTLPVLVLTELSPIDGQEALRLGAHDFLAKPVSARVLTETVARLLAASPVGGAAAC